MRVAKKPRRIGERERARDTIQATQPWETGG